VNTVMNPEGSVEGGERLDELSDYQFLKEESGMPMKCYECLPASYCCS
jgi:hypothetical protein